MILIIIKFIVSILMRLFKPVDKYPLATPLKKALFGGIQHHQSFMVDLVIHELFLSLPLAPALLPFPLRPHLFPALRHQIKRQGA